MTYIFLGLLIFCAHLFNAWFSKRRIPDVLLLMLIGILVGPVSGWVKPEQLNDVGPVFASLTLLFILFDSGIDMRLDVVRRYWTGVVQVTFLSFVLSMATVTVIAFYLTDLELKACMLLGGMVAGTSTSGLFMKEPGRVGDSPLIGSGFYCDARFGAAAATGLGEDIMRGCLSYEIVSLMRRGASPAEACSTALSGLTERKLSLGEDAGSISLIALNPSGEYGAATTLPVFPFAAGREEEASLYAVSAGDSGFRPVTPEEVSGEP